MPSGTPSDRVSAYRIKRASGDGWIVAGPDRDGIPGATHLAVFANTLAHEAIAAADLVPAPSLQSSEAP